MSKNESSGGIGFFGMLQITFIVLKLTHVIDWSWWLVLLPSIVSLGLVAIGLVLVIIKSIEDAE